eukprot:TRINITY_DN34878_c0_g1_i1.p1 TRINITY_DN34878_c0_g1~~TRINITY_DN34878_c0_g1_i1.p1  ORF type:complete len:147 (-),score=21.94 TRINITY_DN34878_c0_g1_i1:19-459(-)
MGKRPRWRAGVLRLVDDDSALHEDAEEEKTVAAPAEAPVEVANEEAEEGMMQLKFPEGSHHPCEVRIRDHGAHAMRADVKIPPCSFTAQEIVGRDHLLYIHVTEAEPETASIHVDGDMVMIGRGGALWRYDLGRCIVQGTSPMRRT